MKNINIRELEVKWENSKNKINQLVLKSDKPTMKMMRFYKLYITSPFDITAKTLFEYAFCTWYSEKMKGEL